MDTQILENLGLSKKAVETYLASLSLGPSSIQKISAKALIPRSSTYLVIGELKNFGLISETKLGKKTIFTAARPEKLIDMANEAREKAERLELGVEGLMSEISALYKEQKGRPSVRFYEGFEGVKTILEETLNFEEILVICSGYDKPLEKKMDKYLDSYFKKIVKKQIKTFEIIGEGFDAKSYEKNFSSKANQIKIVSYKKGLDHIDKLIFGDRTAIISYAYLNGVVIENFQISEFEKEMFWRGWNI